MTAVEKKVAIFVDRACPQHWIVRDHEGKFWTLPPVEHAWDQRQPFYPSEECELDPIPAHYKYMLGMPF
jgi:hypothetical protein